MFQSTIYEFYLLKMIRKLTFENSELLRSQTEIPSIRNAVIELILNSIDANASCISITVHNFTIKVSDDGNGFDPNCLKRNCKY